MSFAQRRMIDRFLSRVDAWQVPALRAAFTAPDARGFYFDSVSQTHMPSWTKGRVAVIGDAGHCAALLSGMGTTLAMVAAETLATTWTEFGCDMQDASPAYHERLRPYVEQCPGLRARRRADHRADDAAGAGRAQCALPGVRGEVRAAAEGQGGGGAGLTRRLESAASLAAACAARRPYASPGQPRP